MLIFSLRALVNEPNIETLYWKTITETIRKEEDLEKLQEKLLGKIKKLISSIEIWFMIEHYGVIWSM